MPAFITGPVHRPRAGQESQTMTARSSRTTRLALGALALLALAGPVTAADLDEEPPPRFEGRGEWRAPPPPPLAHSLAPLPPRIVQGPESCRTFVKRRIDPYGEEVLRRVRVCDESPGYRESGFRDGPRWGGPPPWHRRRHWDDEPGPGRW